MGDIPDGKVVGLIAPDKLQGTAEALVTPRQGCVDDVLTVPTDTDKASVSIVLQGLGVQVTAAQIFDSQGQALAIGLHHRTTSLVTLVLHTDANI